MILRFLNWLTYFLESFLIKNFDGSPYLLRVKLFGRLPNQEEKGSGSAYLHRFFSSDRDRHLHNHPWNWSFSIVLWGGYTEEKRRRDGTVFTRRVWPGMINILGPQDFHRITKLHGLQTWTFFRCGKKDREWGFLVDGYFIPESMYTAIKTGKKVEPSGDPLPEWLLTCFDCSSLMAPPAASYIRLDRFEALPICSHCMNNPNMVKAREIFASALSNEARGGHAG